MLFGKKPENPTPQEKIGLSFNNDDARMVLDEVIAEVRNHQNNVYMADRPTTADAMKEDEIIKVATERLRMVGPELSDVSEEELREYVQKHIEKETGDRELEQA